MSKNNGLITWKEFKEWMDAELKNKGISEEIEIHCLDFSWISDINDLTVRVDSIGLTVC